MNLAYHTAFLKEIRVGNAQHPDEVVDPAPSHRSTWLLLFLIVAGAVLLFLVLRQPPRSSVGMGHAGVGQRLSELKLEPLLNAEKPVSLKDVQGKVTLINYWGPWCPPCLMELPELVELEKEYRGRNDTAILLVSSSGGPGESVDELAQDTRETMQKQKSSAAIYHDENNASKMALIESAKMDSFAFPTTVVVDQQGIIRGVWRGYDPSFVQEMRDVIEQLLRKKT
jgi:thiol-disulfide isomerase/thioredoxin